MAKNITILEYRRRVFNKASSSVCRVVAVVVDLFLLLLSYKAELGVTRIKGTAE